MSEQSELSFPRQAALSSKRFESFSEIGGFIWSIADLLRGDFRRHEYGQVILPLTVLRRLDCVLEPSKSEVLATEKKYRGKVDDLRPLLESKTGVRFYNTSQLDLTKIVGAGQDFGANLRSYIEGFDDEVRDVFLKYFRFNEYIERLERAQLLLLVLQKFVSVDLHPDAVDNHTMGSIYEDLIRRFAEVSNETAGEHFTPREVIALMVDLLFSEDHELLKTKGIVRTLYDPACGTGGMLSVAEAQLEALNPGAKLEVFGQELNPEAYAICKTDMMIKGQEPRNIVYGNSFTEQGHPHSTFHYMLSNPPFGVEWKRVAQQIRDEHELGFGGRFGPGLPRINDGSLLFLMHMVSKMKPADDEAGSRLAIVFNGSPLFTGAAGSGESNIRRWLLEQDLLEAVVEMPDQLFYNTGISTYVWILNNRKHRSRKGKVQLIDGSGFFEKMKKSLGEKRKYISDEGRIEIVRLYQGFEESEHSRIFDSEDFGFHRITVERPLKLSFQVTPDRVELVAEQKAFQNLAKSKKRKDAAREAEIAAGRELQERILEVLRGMDGDVVYRSRPELVKALNAAMKAADIKLTAAVRKAILSALGERDEEAEVCLKKGQPEPDPDLRDTEHVPLKEDIHAYFEREVKPHVPDAWIDESKTKVGYEIPFTRHFYVYTPPRPLEEIEAEIRALEDEIQGMLGEALA